MIARGRDLGLSGQRRGTLVSASWVVQARVVPQAGFGPATIRLTKSALFPLSYWGVAGGNGWLPVPAVMVSPGAFPATGDAGAGAYRVVIPSPAFRAGVGRAGRLDQPLDPVVLDVAAVVGAVLLAYGGWKLAVLLGRK